MECRSPLSLPTVCNDGKCTVHILQPLLTLISATGSKSLTLFARSVQWLTPPLGLQEIRVPGLAAEEVQLPGTLGKHFYTDAEKQALRNNPEGLLDYRKKVDQELQRWFGVFLRDSPLSAMARQAMADGIRTRFGPQHANLADSFVPDFGPGCRRNTVCVVARNVQHVIHQVYLFTLLMVLILIALCLTASLPKVSSRLWSVIVSAHV